MPKLKQNQLINSPLFVMGPPRSGTTILTQILNTSPKVFLSDELRIVAWMSKEIDRISEGFNVHGDPYPFQMGERFALYLQSNGSNFLLNFYKKISIEQGKEKFVYWGDKYPHFDRYLHRIAKIFPRARFILIFRKIDEVINSVMVGHKWTFKKSLDYCIRIYENYLNKIDLINQDNIYVFDYASFNSEKKLEEIEKIFEFLNLALSYKEKEMIVEKLSYQSHSVRKDLSEKKNFDKNKSKLILKDKDINNIYKNNSVIALKKNIKTKFKIDI